MTNLFLIPILASFLITLLILPSWMKRARRAGLVGKDIQKLRKVGVPEAGGVAVVVGFAFGLLLYIAINTFMLKVTDNFIEIFALMSSIFLISFVAFTDDILGWKIGLRRRTRLVLVAFASIPLIAINAGKSSVLFPFYGVVDLGIIYPLLVIPIGIVGATTTYNFLAGFNCLEAGQGIIVLSALAIVAWVTGSPWLSFVALIMASSLLAFLFFNFYPARVFPGDTLTYTVGGLIAIIAILGNFERLAVFFFIPYIAETFLKIRGGLVKQSFGEIKKDGSLELKYGKIYSLNHLSISLMRRFGIKPTEVKVVLSLWAFQILVILIGFAIFLRGVFL